MRTLQYLAGATALLSGSVLGLGAQAQNDGPGSGPPSFTPPPPPSFRPPSAPPQQPPPQGQQQPRPADAGSNGDAAPAQPATAGGASAEYPDQGIVDFADPRLQDRVGLIQIPDLGTNDVLSMLEEFTGKPVLRQQSLPAVKITFFSQNEMSRGEAIRAIESLLALNGIAVTRVGNDFLKAVPAAIINTQVPLLWEGSTLGAVPTQLIYEKMFELEFLAPAEVIGMIQPLMSQGAPIAFEKSGLLLVTDSLVNLQRIERVLSAVDAPSRMRTEILFFQLRNVDAQSALRRLQQIQQGPLKRRLEGNTTFDADENTNQLLVFTHPSNVELVENLIEKMDIDVDPMTSTRVFSIRYAEAVEVVNIIDQVISGQKEVRDAQNNQRQAARQQQANQAAAAARTEASNLQFSDLLTLVADERANSVVASGTPGDLDVLANLVNEIDVLLAQVRIEAVIVEVRLEESDASGISSLSAAYSNTDDGETLSINPFAIGGVEFGGALLGGSGSGEDAVSPGFYFGPGGEFSMGVIFNAVERHLNSQVLSAPTIVTTHNREARISIGERYPIITGTSSSNLSNYVTSQVQRENIGIELSVTPLIGSDNVIQLEIEQSINDIAGSVEINGTEQPIVTTREASSFVSVGDGQLVVLGGLQQSSLTKNTSKFPILGDIPGLDKIFTRETEDDVRREIILFLRPRIIRSAEEADRLTRQQLGTIESRDRVDYYLREGTFNEPTPIEVEIEIDNEPVIPRGNPARRTQP